MATGKSTKRVPASVPFHWGDLLRTNAEVAAFLEELLSDGDPRVVPVALRAAADAVGGMAKLAEKAGLSRETLYRTLSSNGNPRLDTLGAILAAFGLRLSVKAIKPTRVRQRKSGKSALRKPSPARSRRAKST